MSGSQEPRRLRLLSLDGGDIHSISELIILREIMQRIEAKQPQSSETPLPCEFFDMIGGTSTGGLIALMLGRFGMSVDDAIDCYEKLAAETFTEIKWFGGDKSKARKLKSALQNILQQRGLPPDELIMMNEKFQGRQCKTFVCAMPIGAAMPTLFRSYASPKYQNENCTIWEAAHATLAGPTLFKEITISSRRYVDGGLGCYNPTEQMLNEANLIFPGLQIGCVISIGTGRAALAPAPKIRSPLQRFQFTSATSTPQTIAAEREATARNIARCFQDTPNTYFRFSVRRGLPHTGAPDLGKFPDVTDVTESEEYLKDQDVDKMLDGATLAIQGILKDAA